MNLARCAVLALLLVPGLALAQDDVVVTQINKRFSSADLAIRRGQSVTFVNKDRVRHNIAVRTPEGEEQTGVVQSPGEVTKMPFDHPGTYQIHCLIHPMMRLSVDVQ